MNQRGLTQYQIKNAIEVDVNSYRFVVSLRLIGGNVEPSEIASALRETPKWQHKLGDPRIDPHGQSLGGNYQENFFCIDLHPVEASLSRTLEHHALNLKQHASILERVRRSGGKVEFFVGCFFKEDSGEVFSPSTLKACSDINIHISFNWYVDLQKRVFPFDT
jgi:hypothetical protein